MLRFRFLALLAAMVMSGCVLTPKEPNFAMTVDAPRAKLVDCMYVALRAENPVWNKVDLESLGANRLTVSNDEADQGYLEFVSKGPGSTAVTAYLYGGLLGPQYWTRKLRPMVEACV